MVNTETTDTAATHCPKKRAPKSKPTVMNGTLGDFREGHDLQEMPIPFEHPTLEELHAKRLSKELEAAQVQEELQQILREYAERSEVAHLHTELDGLKARCGAYEDELENSDNKQKEAEIQCKKATAEHDTLKLRFEQDFERVNADWTQQMAEEVAKVKQEGAAALAEALGAAHAAGVETQALQAKLESSLQDCKTRETGLQQELHQAMDVLGDWQHYGRTRNTHFEDMVKKCNEREAEIGHLKRQLEVAGVQPWTISSFPIPGVAPQQMPAHSGPGMLPAPPTQQAFSGVHAHGPPPPQQQLQQHQQQAYDHQQQMQHSGQFIPQLQHAQHAQHAHQAPQHAQQQRPAGPDMRPNSASAQQPQQSYRTHNMTSSPQSQQLVAVLMELLPFGEENAIAMSHELDLAAQERFPAVWDVLRQNQFSNLAAFMAARSVIFPRRAADGFFFLPRQQTAARHSMQQSQGANAAGPTSGSEVTPSLKPRDGSPISQRDATVAPPPAGITGAAIQRPMPQSGTQSILAQLNAAQQPKHQPQQKLHDVQPTRQASAPHAVPLQGRNSSFRNEVGQQQQQVQSARSGVPPPPGLIQAQAPPPVASRPAAPIYVTPFNPEGVKILEEKRRQAAEKAQASVREAAANLYVKTESSQLKGEVASSGNKVLLVPRPTVANGSIPAASAAEHHSQHGSQPGSARSGGRSSRNGNRGNGGGGGNIGGGGYAIRGGGTSGSNSQDDDNNISRIENVAGAAGAGSTGGLGRGASKKRRGRGGRGAARDQGH